MELRSEDRDDLPNITDYRANLRRVNGFGFFYKNIGLNIGFQAPESLNNTDKYGENEISGYYTSLC